MRPDVAVLARNCPTGGTLSQQRSFIVDIDEIISAAPVMPVLVIHELEKAVPLARALVEGGLKTIEVTLRTPIAMEAVAAITRAVPEATVGVGTLTRPEQFAMTAEAGAQFAVSPGLTRVMLNACAESGMPYLPGVFTPSEAMAARDVGFKYLKLFPARQAGGIDMLKALAGPFPELKFCPTGGVDKENFLEYLALPNVPSVGGHWLAPQEAIVAGDWDRVTRLAAETKKLI
jgi:2-dehydro-3-deoxyphosphogluconate aldolase/(4S)-4-hydroxy-2-oxoglutarate aldolase